MARSFASASSQYLRYAGAVLTAQPLTIAGLVYQGTLVAAGIAQIKIQAATALRDGWTLELNGTGNVVCTHGNSAGISTDTSTAAITAATWQHVGLSNDGSNISSWVNGTKKDTASTRIPGAVNVTVLGARYSGGTLGSYLNGQLAEWAVWSAVLTADEMTALKNGVSPLMIRPAALVAYWPTIGRNSPETDIVGNYDLTVTGATASEHPRIIRPSAKILTFPSASGTIGSGVGSSAGTSTAAATGISTAASSGTAPGVATASATGISTAASAGTSAGTSTAAAVGEDAAGGIQSAVGTSAGTSTASATGASTAATAGSSAGVATASAVGSSSGGVQEGVGTSAGVATVSATGASTAAAVGTAAGVATASAVGSDSSARLPIAMTFTLAHRSAEFSLAQRSMTFALRQRSMTMTLEAA